MIGFRLESRPTPERFRFMKIVALLFCSMFVFHPLAAWWSFGHMLTGQVAADQLSQKEKNWVASTMSGLPGIDEKFPFLHASTLPDEIKPFGNFFNDWHYIDIPVPAQASPQIPSPNARWAICEALLSLERNCESCNPKLQKLYICHL